MKRRVVITGCGVVTPAGTELDRFWSALISGSCFIAPLRGFSCLGMEGLMGAEVELPAAEALPAEVDLDERRSRCAALALAAARRAWTDAAWPTGADLGSIGVVMGSTMAEERQVTGLSDRGKTAAQAQPGHWLDSLDAGFLARANNHRLPSLIAAQHGLGGPVMLNATACSSGNAATAWAYDLVASGAAPAMLAGGADSFTRLIYAGFHRMGALSKSVCRPFDRRRDGVSFGEGAAMVMLEDLEHARRRGARIYAELAGYGVSNDAHHITAPEPNGEGFARAMNQALTSTGTAAQEISYVSAHGTGTPYNDVGEARAMKAVFGEHARQIPISSIKSMIGHTNGAAGAIETVACALALHHQAVPPTANLEEPDPECDLDCVPGRGRAMRVETCLNLGAGFGGFNVCVLLKRAP
jgi:3-oxoacyl-[acyl-carrier-protein] synthase II